MSKTDHAQLLGRGLHPLPACLECRRVWAHHDYEPIAGRGDLPEWAVTDGLLVLRCHTGGTYYRDPKAIAALVKRKVRAMPEGRLRAVIAFAREEWLNDGAEGETVHLLCDELEARLPTSSPAEPDPLHPTGRCTCAGEGTCAWCKTVCPECGGDGWAHDKGPQDLCPRAETEG